MPEATTDPVKRKIKKWMGWGSAIATGAGAIVTPIWLLVADLRGDVKGAKEGTEASYETLAPVVSDLQDDLKTGMSVVGDLATRAKVLEDARSLTTARVDALSQRLTRCETYIEVMSRGRFKPAEEPIEPVYDGVTEPMVSVESDEDGTSDLEPPDAVQQIIRRPERPVPKSLVGAKKYQKQRESLSCSDNDPLCGM